VKRPGVNLQDQRELSPLDCQLIHDRLRPNVRKRVVLAAGKANFPLYTLTVLFGGSAEGKKGRARRKHPFGDAEETRGVHNGSEPSGTRKECTPHRTEAVLRNHGWNMHRCSSETILRNRGRRSLHAQRKRPFGVVKGACDCAQRKRPFGGMEETYSVHNGSEPSGTWKKCANRVRRK